MSWLEPKRQTSLDSLWPPFRTRVDAILDSMRKRGYDPVVFEARRSEERQRWLYGVGRTHHKWRRPVTWTMHSKHLVGKAADIISKSRGWNWPQFYEALKDVAWTHNCRTLDVEQCHVEWRG